MSKKFNFDEFLQRKKELLDAEQARQELVASYLRKDVIHPAITVRDAYLFCYKNKNRQFRVKVDGRLRFVGALVDFSAGADARIGFSVADGDKELYFLGHMEALGSDGEYLEQLLRRLPLETATPDRS